MLELLEALNRYAKTTGFSVATSAAHLLGVVLEIAEHSDIAFDDAAVQLTEHLLWLAKADEPPTFRRTRDATLSRDPIEWPHPIRPPPALARPQRPPAPWPDGG
jgi:hypothetical protein